MDAKTASIHKRLGPRYERGPSPKSSKLCRHYQMGYCWRDPCNFSHSELPRSNVYRRNQKQFNVPPEDGVMKYSKFQPRQGRKRNSVSPPMGSLKCYPNMLVLIPGTSHDTTNDGTVTEELPRNDASNENPPSSHMKYRNVNRSRGESSSSIVSTLRKFRVLRDHTEICRENPVVSSNVSANLKDMNYSDVSSDKEDATLKDENHSSACPNTPSTLQGGTAISEVNEIQQNLGKACEFWMSDSCVKGDACQFLHSWFCGDSFSMLAKLKGHNQAITGIAHPSGSDKLYSGSKDGTVHVWDCHTGQPTKVLNFGCQIGSLISAGVWVFVGMPGVVMASNIETAADFSLHGPSGQVHALVAALDMLFGGAQDGAISVWKGSTETPEPFQLATSLKGHNGPVTCLKVGNYQLFSGSMDGTIKVWDLNTLECIQTLSEHKNPVKDLICWNGFLLSCSLDRTIKVWSLDEEHNWKLAYTRSEKNGILALCGLYDSAEKSILYCSCDDNVVRLYELPTFSKMGRIFSKGEVVKIQEGPGGLFFTGDESGELTVWKLAESSRASA